jgi:hypothetical protein
MRRHALSSMYSMRVAPIRGAVLALAAVVTLGADQATPARASRPDFSGTWILDVDATRAAAQQRDINGTGIFGETFVAAQDAARLSLQITAGPVFVSASYALDGTTSHNTSPPNTPDGKPIDVRSTARWDGARLLVDSESQSPGQGPGAVNGLITVKSTRVMYFEAEGARLVIERTGTPTTVLPPSISVYKRAG